MKPDTIGMDIGIAKNKAGRPMVTIDVKGDGRAVLCMTAKAARIYADGLREAADLLDKMATEQ